MSHIFKGKGGAFSFNDVQEYMQNSVGVATGDTSVWVGSFASDMMGDAIERGAWVPLTVDAAKQFVAKMQEAIEDVETRVKPKKYLYNVMTTVEVEANDPDTALDILNDGGGELVDRDVLLVEEDNA